WPLPFCGASASSPKVPPGFESEGPDSASRSMIAFHLGSCTKAMTATLVAMLVEEGKLNWITTLGELFVDTVKPMHPAWEKVTLRQVLAHRAGLPLEPDGLAPVFSLLRELMRPPRARLGTLPQ